MSTTVLDALGWTTALDAAFASHAERGLQPGRISVQHRDLYRLLTPAVTDAADVTGLSEVEGIVTGRFRHHATSPADFPAVGDWVAFGPSELDGPVSIHAVLPRRSTFSRQAAGTVPYEQVIATNVDTVFIVSGLDGNHRLRRIERYVAQGWESGAVPVVVLNKADLCDDLDGILLEARSTLVGVDVHAVSGERGDGVEALTRYLGPGRTVAFVGSSGVGKSTLVNRLLGEQRMETQNVRAGDSRGRHTTTHRELLPMPGGALLIDTPGMREFALWAGGDDEDDGTAEVEDTFEDVAELAKRCRFPNCRHMGDPGCRVQEAVQAGELDYGRVKSFRALVREVQVAAKRDNPGRMRPDADAKRRSKRAGRREGRRRLRDGEDDG
jgi:ribosome biogenesis GTPase